jgi:pimeloyl-ACP methyl ester carboxylesterase
VVGWRPVHDELSKDYDVIAIDLPGFGHSPGLPAGVTPTAAALADAVEGELDWLGVVQFHVAGYSLGARVALELATRGPAPIRSSRSPPTDWARRWNDSTRRRPC